MCHCFQYLLCLHRCFLWFPCLSFPVYGKTSNFGRLNKQPESFILENKINWFLPKRSVPLICITLFLRSQVVSSHWLGRFPTAKEKSLYCKITVTDDMHHWIKQKGKTLGNTFTYLGSQSEIREVTKPPQIRIEIVLGIMHKWMQVKWSPSSPLGEIK